MNFKINLSIYVCMHVFLSLVWVGFNDINFNSKLNPKYNPWLFGFLDFI